MYPYDQQAFQPIFNSSHCSFNSSAIGTTSVNYALESTATRDWQFPSSRTVRLLADGSALYYANFGTSSVAAASSNSVLCKGGEEYKFTADVKQTYVALVSSTSVTVNITLGIGK